MPLKLDGTYGVSGVVGTASSAAIYGDDVDSGIVFSGNQTLINSDGSTIATVGASGINVTGVVTATSSVRIGTGASIGSPATNVLTLGTNNVESVRIDSSSNIGIGTTVPRTKLDVAGGGYFTGFSNPTSSGRAGLEIGYDGSQGIVQCYDRPNNVFKNIQYQATQHIFAGGNIKVDSGYGIDFSATTDATGSSSELLSDYEEGVHTVTLKRSSGGTTLTQGTHYHILSSQTTSNSNQYRYIKIGNVVHLSFSIRFLASEAGQNGRYNISLPYSIAGNGYSFAGSIGLYNFNQTLNQGIFLSSTATSLDFFDLAAGNGTHTNLYPNSGAEIYFNGYYFTI